MRIRLLSRLLLFPGILFGLALGCSTRTTSLQISGTPGAEFTAHYHAGGISGSVTTVTQAGRPAVVLELPGRGFSCEITKQDAASDLTVEVAQAGRTTYRTQAPPGTQSIRIRHTKSGWERQTL